MDDREDVFKIAGTLTETEALELNRLLDLTNQVQRSIWRKLIVPAEMKYRRTFEVGTASPESKALPAAGETNEDR